MNKIKNQFLVTGMLSLGLLLNACKSSDEKASNQNTMDTGVNTARTQPDTSRPYVDSIADYQISEKEWANEIAANQNTIDEYKAQIALENEEERRSHEKKVADLERLNNSLKATMQDFKEDGKEDWKKFKTGFNKSVSDFKEKMNEFGQSIKHIGNKKDKS